VYATHHLGSFRELEVGATRRPKKTTTTAKVKDKQEIDDVGRALSGHCERHLAGCSVTVLAAVQILSYFKLDI